jgi:thiol-disulfide isomerase/thioredoxin
VNGVVLRATPEGTLQDLGRSGIRYPVVAADPRRPGAWLARRHQRWEYRLPAASDPLLIELDADGSPARSVGHPVEPRAVLLSELANAGQLAVKGDTAYYAPFIRDRVIAFSASGDTLWVAERRLPQDTDQPDFQLAAGRPVINYHPVNLGAVVGPDDRLYVLSTPGFTTTEARLDVFDRMTGELLRSAQLATALPTLAGDRDGRVYLLDEFELLTGIAPAERATFAPFDLELLGGGRLASAALAGRVTLVNFWASWCEPCRTEMPALDSLRRGIADPRFQFLTMNDDASVEDAAAFVRAFGFDFPVLLGRGRLRERYRYLGLPMTVLVDAGGRIVQRWIGFAGPLQIGAIKAVLAAELRRMDDAPEAGAHGRH